MGAGHLLKAHPPLLQLTSHTYLQRYYTRFNYPEHSTGTFAATGRFLKKGLVAVFVPVHTHALSILPVNLEISLKTVTARKMLLEPARLRGCGTRFTARTAVGLIIR
jgi:hypothetical protein